MHSSESLRHNLDDRRQGRDGDCCARDKPLDLFAKCVLKFNVSPIRGIKVGA